MANNSSLPESITLDAKKGLESVKIFDSLPLNTGIFEVKVVVTDPTTQV